MAIEIKKQSNKNAGTYLLVILLLALVGWAGWSFFRTPDFLISTDVEELLPSSSQELMEAELNIGNILDNSIFQTLTSHIVWPLEVPDLGRANPFKSL